MEISFSNEDCLARRIMRIADRQCQTAFTTCSSSGRTPRGTWLATRIHHQIVFVTPRTTELLYFSCIIQEDNRRSGHVGMLTDRRPIGPAAESNASLSPP